MRPCGRFTQVYTGSLWLHTYCTSHCSNCSHKSNSQLFHPVQSSGSCDDISAEGIRQRKWLNTQNNMPLYFPLWPVKVFFGFFFLLFVFLPLAWVEGLSFFSFGVCVTASRDSPVKWESAQWRWGGTTAPSPGGRGGGSALIKILSCVFQVDDKSSLL